MWQELIVAGCILIALGFMLRRLTAKAAGCSGCSGCGKAKQCGSPENKG